ncbi:MAG: leucine-rich repeat protein [Lachnospiraceae bacterium]|nr:leucine-rich repeat protein [Lachnospiraceae bacterium]
MKIRNAKMRLLSILIAVITVFAMMQVLTVDSYAVPCAGNLVIDLSAGEAVEFPGDDHCDPVAITVMIWFEGDDQLFDYEPINDFEQVKMDIDRDGTWDVLLKTYKVNNKEMLSFEKLSTCSIAHGRAISLPESRVEYYESINEGGDSIYFYSSASFIFNKGLPNVNDMSYSLQNDWTVRANYYLGDVDALEEYEIPQSIEVDGADCPVTTINMYAFEGCSNLKRVTIPASVTKIQSRAFTYCSSELVFHYLGTKQQWNAIEKGSDWTSSSNPTVHYPTMSIRKATLDSDGAEGLMCSESGCSDWTCSYAPVTVISRPKTFTLSAKTFVCDGSEKRPGVTVKDAKGKVIDASNYDVTYSDNVQAGSAKATVTFKGERYSGKQTLTFTIEPGSIENADITGIADMTYTGEALTPSPIVKIGGTELTAGTDYEVAYENNTNVGTATVTITGIGSFTGSVTRTFAITPKLVAVPKAKTLTYNGKTQTGVAGSASYTISGNTGTKAGSYKAVLKLKDKVNFAWSDGETADKTVAWTISPKSITPKVTTVTKAVYTGKALKPEVTVKNGTTTLTKGTDYTVTYSSNTKVGKASVTVKLKGNYKGTKTVSFTINPKKAEISKTEPGKKQIKITMKTKASATGGSTYQIQYRVKGSSKWKETTATGLAKTIKNLEKGKVYQVRVRAYKTVSGKTYYGAWSATKTTKKVQ